MPQRVSARTTTLTVLAALVPAAVVVAGDCTPEPIARIEAPKADLDSQFGIAIDMNDAVALVGERVPLRRNYRGLVHVLDPADGSTITTFDASGTSPGDLFGVSIAVDGDRAVIGAAREQSSYGGFGAAYLFDISDPANPVELSRVGNSVGGSIGYGYTTAISGDRMLIGAQAQPSGGDTGRAYLYDISDVANPVLISTLDPTEAHRRFGRAVALSADVALVADPGFVRGVEGVIYVYDAATGSFLSEILAPADTDSWGTAVEIVGNRALIAASGDDERSANAGALFVYDLDTGTQLMKLMADDGGANDGLGLDDASLRTFGDLAVIGAPQHDDGAGVDVGAAYIFDVTTGTQLAKLRSDAARNRGFLGFATAMNASRVFTGAPRDDRIAYDSGAVHIFESCGGATECTGDIDGDGGVTIADLLALLTAWGPCEGCPEDLDGDGAVTFADLIEVLAGWGPCP